MISPNKIKLYIASRFFKKFFQITLSFSLIIFFVNLVENSSKVKESGAEFYAIFLMSFFQIPDFLNEIIISIILISSTLTYFTLSNRSEITIIRSSGFSIWSISKSMAFASLILGIFWVLIFDPISSLMLKKYNQLELFYVEDYQREIIAPQDGIWIRQENLAKKDHELLINAKKVIKEFLEFNNITIWFFDDKGRFYKKIDAKEMFHEGRVWRVEKAVINDKNFINKSVSQIEIPTNLKSDFIYETVVSNFQNVKLFSVYQLFSLIKNLEEAGFSATKFSVYLQSLLAKPIMFFSMTLIACFFGINHIRDNKAILMIFLGIVLGIAVYVISGIMISLGSSGLIPIFASTWLISLISLSTGILLIYQKEKF
jgi:lipopolysaccharide export system permease protein